MFTLHLDDTVHTVRQLDSIEEVESSLDGLAQVLTPESALLVTIERVEDGTALSIGLGRSLSVLNFVGRNGDPPYFTSAGGGDASHSITFLFGGQLSEFPMRNAIPLVLARSAMRIFCATGQLTKDVQWEEV
jgi:hypothetical protein